VLFPQNRKDLIGKIIKQEVDPELYLNVEANVDVTIGAREGASPEEITPKS
jgi:hypothetical protein